MPDNVSFTPDGLRVLTANEGEPNDDYSLDLEDIISISGSIATLFNANVTTPRPEHLRTNSNWNTSHSGHFLLFQNKLLIFGRQAIMERANDGIQLLTTTINALIAFVFYTSSSGIKIFR